MPLEPRMTSAPAPPLTVIWISAARLPAAEKESTPPLALRTSCSLVTPMSIENGRRIEAVEADARAVGGRREDLAAVAAVDLDFVDAGAALVEVGVVARVPDHPVVTGLAEDLVVGVATGERVVLAAPEEQVEPAFAEQRVVLGQFEQHVAAGSAGQDVARPTVEIGARRTGGLAHENRVVSAQAEHLDQARVGDRGAGDEEAIPEDLAGRIAGHGDDAVKVVADDRDDAVRARRHDSRHDDVVA